MWRTLDKKFSHLLERDSDAALGRAIVMVFQVKKYGAAGISLPGREIIIKHQANVIKVVLAPQFFMGAIEGQTNQLVIKTAGRVIAPAIIGRERE